MAVTYAGPEELLATAVPYLRRGVHAGDLVLAVTTPEKLALLQAELGEDARDVQFLNAAAWYSSPAAALYAYETLVADQQRLGRRVRAVGELPWQAMTPVEQRGWRRYEALVNLAFPDGDLDTRCLYETSVLDPSVVAAARASHPLLAPAAAQAHPSGEFVEPAAYCARLDAEPLPVPPGEADRMEFTAVDLGDLRRHVDRAARSSRLPVGQAEELTVAVHEIAANAVRHGGGRGELRTWREGRHLVFEVQDEGKDRPDPLIGHLRGPVADGRTGGYGLWIARQLCDLLEVRHGPGWQVRLYAAVPIA